MHHEKEINRIKNLISLYLRNNLSREQENELNYWLKQSIENKRLFVNLSKEENILNDYNTYKKINTSSAWNKVNSKINYPKPKQYNLKTFIGYAAAILILFGSTLTFLYVHKKKSNSLAEIVAINDIKPGSEKAMLITSTGDKIELKQNKAVSIKEASGVSLTTDSTTLYYNTPKKNKNENINQYHTIVIPKGAEYNLILSDGTHVYLNSDSRLKYPIVFNGKKREVYLEGEAFFDVAKNKEKPFIVKSKDFSVKALGTSFNVMNYDDEAFAHTTLKTGKVEVCANDKKVILNPGQQAYLKNKDIKVKSVNVNIYTSWMNEKFNFANETLDVIMRKVSRWYNVEVFYASPSIKNYHFSGNIPKYTNISKVFELLELTTNVKFKIKDKTITVMKKEK